MEDNGGITWPADSRISADDGGDLGKVMPIAIAISRASAAFAASRPAEQPGDPAAATNVSTHREVLDDQPSHSDAALLGFDETALLNARNRTTVPATDSGEAETRVRQLPALAPTPDPFRDGREPDLRQRAGMAISAHRKKLLREK